MTEKIVSITLIVFLLLTSVASVSAFHIGINKSKIMTPAACYITIYVDDDNTEGPWDGTLEHPYKSIMNGVDNASEGDKVFVFNGIYNDEHIYIRKTIKLIGEDKDNTIIYGPYFQVLQVNGFEIHNFWFNNPQPIFLYDCSNCIISGNIIIDFRSGWGIVLTNCSNCTLSDNNIQAYHAGPCAELRAKSVNNKIKNNILYGCNLEGMDDTTGICITHDSNDSTVENNMINNFDGAGIEIHDNTRAIIVDNIINNTKYGIDVLYSSNHKISRNKITNNSEGINTDSSDNVTISDNIIKDNTAYGISLSHSKDIEISRNIVDNNPCGIAFCLTERSTFSNNTVTNSSEIGINVMDSGKIDSNNLISYNKVKNCYCGIMAEHSWGNTYKNNTVNYNELGIMIYGEAKFNIITKNEVVKNGFGIVLYGFIKDGKKLIPFGNLVIANNICENFYCGAYATILTRFNQIYYNNFVGNYLNAFDNGTNLWYRYKTLGQSKGNYWDDYEGVDDQWPWGVGDTPYIIEGKTLRPSRDNYPSMDPFDINDMAVNAFEVTELNDSKLNLQISTRSLSSCQLNNQPSITFQKYKIGSAITNK